MSANSKDIRKQVRNVMQEYAKEYLSQELVDSIRKELAESQSKRLDSIEKFCQESLGGQDKRARAMHGFLVNIVKGEVQNDLYNMSITLDAYQQVLGELLGAEKFADFNVRVDAAKLQIDADRKKAADEKMKKDMEERVAKAKEAQENAPTASLPQVEQAPAESNETADGNQTEAKAE